MRGGPFQADTWPEQAHRSDSRGRVDGGHQAPPGIGRAPGSGAEAGVEQRLPAGLDAGLLDAGGEARRARGWPAGGEATDAEGGQTRASRPQPGTAEPQADVRPSSRSACCPQLAPGTLAHGGGAPRWPPHRGGLATALRSHPGGG